MTASELIETILKAVEQIKSQGNSTIPVAGLERYLSDMQESLRANGGQSNHDPEHARELAKRQWESTLEQYKYRAAESLEMFKAVIEAGQTAIKSAFIINGGASIALLTFVGNLMTKEGIQSRLDLSGFGQALLVFVVGVGVAGAANTLRYLSQASYGQALQLEKTNIESAPKWRMSGDAFRNLAMISCLASYGLFFWGGAIAYSCITFFK
jgi:hypothetical protein